MTVSSVEMYVAFQKLFKSEKAAKTDVLTFGVDVNEFDKVDTDTNEYLDIDEALNSNDISELLYGDMMSTYGVAASDEAQKQEDASKRTGGKSVIDLNKVSGSNPFKNV